MNKHGFRQRQIRDFCDDNIIMSANSIIQEFIKLDNFFDSELLRDLFCQTHASIKTRLDKQMDVIGRDFCPEDDGEDGEENDSEKSEGYDDDVLEPYEFYFVSESLARHLYAKGELIARDFEMPIWGRQTTGQAIYLDNIIEIIFDEMHPATYDAFNALSVWEALKKVEWLQDAVKVIKSFQEANGSQDVSLLEFYENDGASLNDNIRDAIGEILKNNLFYHFTSLKSYGK